MNGVLHFANGSFRLLPRRDSDISFKFRTGVDSHPVELALRVSPNPGVSHIVSFTLPKKDRVELGVYDLQGRRVAWIARGVLGAGAHTGRWGGAAANGARAGAGMYFYRLKVGNEIRTVRAVMLE